MGINQTFSAIAIAILSFGTPASTQAQAAQSGSQPEIQERPISLVGCIQRESDYRRMHDKGRGGPVGLGGRGDEFVLVNAVEVAEGETMPAQARAACDAAEAGEAYELEGDFEDDLMAFVGRRVHISGKLEHADVDVTTARPSGGVDPLGQDLELAEVEVLSFREPMQRAEASPSAAAQSSAAMQQVSPAEPKPVGTSGVQARADMPRTATPLPLVGLIGVLSLAGALGLRLVGRS